MKLLVLVAGVLDPKWPLAPDAGGLPEPAAERMILSPFDEAALEIALRIRDVRPEARIRAIVAGGESAAKLARAVSALNIADVATIALQAPWDQGAVAHELAGACGDTDLILIGREFGDCDDGLVPPMLAGLLGRPYFGRAQLVDTAGALRLMREAGGFEEWLPLSAPIVASVTNDRRCRLRKPLMKNVMIARQAAIAAITGGPVPPRMIELTGVSEISCVRAPVDCAMLEGSHEDQARKLAELLLEVRQ